MYTLPHRTFDFMTFYVLKRELHIREREKELEQMVQLKAPEDHDIQSWSECDVVRDENIH